MSANVEHHSRHVRPDMTGHRGNGRAVNGLLGKPKARAPGEGTEDIGRLARAIGFSPGEVLKIEAIYRSTPTAKLK